MRYENERGQEFEKLDLWPAGFAEEGLWQGLDGVMLFQKQTEPLYGGCGRNPLPNLAAKREQNYTLVGQFLCMAVWRRFVKNDHQPFECLAGSCRLIGVARCVKVKFCLHVVHRAHGSLVTGLENGILARVGRAGLRRKTRLNLE